MVGLSILLESHCHTNGNTPSSSATTKKTSLPPLVLNKATMTIKPPPSLSSSGSRFHRLPPPESFLDSCLLCRQKLLPGKDIYMYKGDRAFCSEECRLNQMLMEEEDEENANNSNLSRRRRASNNYNNCSLAAMKPTESSAGKTQNHRRSTRSRPGGGGGFAR